MAIPVVNLIAYIVWALGAGNRNRVTFCRATLLWGLLGVIFYVLIAVLGLGVGRFAMLRA